MNAVGTTIPRPELTISDTPGFIMPLSCRTSFATRAMMSPTRCRLWKVWLLPSKLTYSSSRASRSSRCPITSMR